MHKKDSPEKQGVFCTGWKACATEFFVVRRIIRANHLPPRGEREDKEEIFGKHYKLLQNYHSERSKESHLFSGLRSFTSFRMTKNRF
jgi:hypothetical protein